MITITMMVMVPVIKFHGSSHHNHSPWGRLTVKPVKPPGSLSTDHPGSESRQDRKKAPGILEVHGYIQGGAP